MRIVSKFKDYYDFIGYRYGEDPEVVYLRGKVKSYDKKLDPPISLSSRDDKATRTTYEVELLVAGELLFPLVRMTKRTNDIVGTPIEHVSYRHLDESTLGWIYNEGNSHYYTSERVWGSFQDGLRSLKRKLPEVMRACGAPVFVLKTAAKGHGLVVDEHVPILQELGIPPLVPPEAMWQNIYSTLSNVVRTNPDKAPPVEIADKDKIVKAGFDLKTSFRDPVNQKPKKRRK